LKQISRDYFNLKKLKMGNFFAGKLNSNSGKKKMLFFKNFKLNSVEKISVPKIGLTL